MTIVELASVTRQRVATIRQIQQHPSKALQGVTRVFKNGKAIGIFLDEEALDELQEDLEALSSPTYIKSIAKARAEIKAGKTISLEKVMKKYGL